MVELKSVQMSLAGISPALILCIAGLIALMAGLFVRRGQVATSAIICLVGVAVAFVGNAPLRTMKEIAFNGMLTVDAYGWFFNMVILAAAGLTILISARYMSDQRLQTYEYFVLLLFCSAGMMFMVSGNHLLTIFVGLETLSICVYVLTGILPGSEKAREAALKYLLLGAFSSAIFLYGVAFLYGSGAGLSLGAIAKDFKSGHVSLMASTGMVLLIAGFGFKVAAVPFHMWTPDVYEGAPAPITGYMSVGVKAAAFATFARVSVRVGGTASRDMDQHSLVPCGADHDRWELGRARSAEHQADARILKHSSRGIHPDWHGRWHRGGDRWYAGPPFWPTHSPTSGRLLWWPLLAGRARRT